MQKLSGLLLMVGLFSALTASSPRVLKTEVEFEVKVGSRTLGDFKVVRQVLGEREDFVIEQVIEDGLLHRSKVHYKVHSQYFDGHLQVMEMSNTVDNVLLQSTELRLREETYLLHTDLGKIQMPATEMTNGTAFLFFEEPIGWTSVFHEKYGQTLPMSETSDHMYEIELPNNGGREVFTYTDGRLTMFMIEKTFGMFSMTLKEPLAKS